MVKKEIFVIREEHIMLLNRLYINSNGEIDPKRPFGNSDITSDIYEILGWDNEHEEYTSEANSYLKEIPLVLQICLCNLSFSTGVYIKDKIYDDRSWRPFELKDVHNDK